MIEKQFIQDIVTENVLIVRSKCPMDSIVYDKDFEFYKRCISCEFMAVMTNESMQYACAWKEYITPFIRTSQETDDDDSYAMPTTDYVKVIKCYHCGAEISEHSGMSMLSFGNVLRCDKCKTPHFYLKSTGKPNFNPIFAIPFNTEKHNGK